MVKLLSLFSIFVFLLILQEAEAISLGSLVKRDSISIENSESARFEILFWNVEENSYNLKIEVKEMPQDWFVFIQPQEFSLNSSTGNQYIILPYTNKAVKAFSVSIIVKPRENERSGKYTIVLTAKAGLPAQGINFLQEREFRLNVELKGEKNQTGNENKNFENRDRTLIENLNIQANFSRTFYVLASIVILVVSLLIYKHA